MKLEVLNGDECMDFCLSSGAVTPCSLVEAYCSFSSWFYSSSLKIQTVYSSDIFSLISIRMHGVTSQKIGLHMNLFSALGLSEVSSNGSVIKSRVS
jgi:hypothetical protein